MSKALRNRTSEFRNVLRQPVLIASLFLITTLLAQENVHAVASVSSGVEQKKHTRPNAQSAIKDVSSHSCVILLHGLARTSSSMNAMRDALLDSGFAVANIGYQSRKNSIEELAIPTLERGIAKCADAGASSVHVVTHSMGGILVRYYLSKMDGDAIDRIVMLAPPNQGSEAVDALRDVPGFSWLNGPAGKQLGTDSASIPKALGPVNADVGIVAGTFSINLILSSYLPDPDDGKVSVQSTRVDGMCAHLQVDVSHPFIMEDELVIRNTILYLQTGRFVSNAAEYFDCAAR